MWFWLPVFKEEESQNTAAAETNYENKVESSWEQSHGGDLGAWLRIIETSRLEETFKIRKSNHEPKVC